MQQFFRLRYMLSWPVSVKFSFRLDRRNTWVSALIIRRLWKLLSPSGQRLAWSISAKRCLMTSLPGMQWGYTGSLDMLECEVMRSLMSLQGVALFWGFLGPELALEVSRQDIQNRLGRWLVNQHWERWWGLGDTQRQARELILGRSLGAYVKFLTFNRTQSRAVTGLLTGHNTLRRHLHLLRLLDSPLCRRCGVRQENSAHILCEGEALASLRHAYLGFFFLEPENIKNISLGAIWNFSKVMGLPWFDMGHKWPVN